MSNEITVRASLSVTNGNLQYQSRPTTFRADQNTVSPVGPTPGSFVATTAGVDADLSHLKAYGGWCLLQNYDSTNFVTYGIKAGATFYPLGKLLAGEVVVLRLADGILYGASGTAVTQSFHFVANTASCVVAVEAFDP